MSPPFNTTNVRRSNRLAHQLQLCIPTMKEIAVERPLIPPILVATILALGAAGTLAPLLPLAFRNSSPALAVSLRQWLWIIGFLTPLIVVLKGTLSTGLAWGWLTLNGVPVAPRALFSILFYGEAVLGLQGAVIGAALRFLGTARLRTPADLFLPTGADLFGLPHHPLAHAVVQHLSIFHVAWFTLLLVGLPALTTCSRRVAGSTALFLWTVSVGIDAVRAWGQV